MLPVFNDPAWLGIMLWVAFGIIKDFKRFKEFNIYLKILYVSSVVSIICLLDILVGKIFFNKTIPIYFNMLAPINIIIFIVSIFCNALTEIKTSDKSQKEKNKEYRKQKLAILGFIFAGIWMYLMTIGISLFSIIGNIFGKIFNFIL